MARDFEALKPVLTALAADHLKLDENLKLDKLDILTESGAVAIEGLSVAVGAINGGAETGFSEHFAARSISLPAGLVPPMYAPVIPTSFDFGFKASGFDIEAAGQEWLADVSYAGDGPTLSPQDKGKVSAKLMGTRPIVVDIPASHIRGRSSISPSRAASPSTRASRPGRSR